jgi:hypothetical protein
LFGFRVAIGGLITGTSGRRAFAFGSISRPDIPGILMSDRIRMIDTPVAAFWMEKLEGPLHSVRVAHCKLIKPAELKTIDGEFRLH